MTSRSETSPLPRVRLARKHHLLVRVSHWVNVLLLAGLIVSGQSAEGDAGRGKREKVPKFKPNERKAMYE